MAVKSKTDFNEEIRPIWTGITPTYIQSLYGSIPKRIQQVIDHSVNSAAFVTEYSSHVPVYVEDYSYLSKGATRYGTAGRIKMSIN